MDTISAKRASSWYFNTVFRDEAIRPKNTADEERLPSLLQTARSLEDCPDRVWQSRESVFLKQAKLLAQYEDDYVFTGNVVRYYPTYQSLTDRELRGYFSWRTKLRNGNLILTSLSFAFLYIYELLNQIGVQDPMDGYRKLCAFRDDYGTLDESILSYLERWLTDYVVYYELDPHLLSGTRQLVFDRSILVLETIQEQTDTVIMEAIKSVAPKWLSRSKFYGNYSDDCDRVIAASLRRISEHYAKHTKKTMTEHYFGRRTAYPIRLFDTAVFCDPLRKKHCEYSVDPLCCYRCDNKLWTVTRYPILPHSVSKLEDTLKTVDAIMRNIYGYKHPVKQSLDTKWLVTIIYQETEKLFQQKKDAEAKKISIDYGKLSRIRQEAAITQEKLTVDDPEEPETPSRIPVPQETQLLTEVEYRLLHCLLYGNPVDWVRREGYIQSVLLDSINDKLYDTFQDSVLNDAAEVLEDYMDEMKEMIPL